MVPEDVQRNALRLRPRYRPLAYCRCASTIDRRAEVATDRSSASGIRSASDAINHIFRAEKAISICIGNTRCRCVALTSIKSCPATFSQPSGKRFGEWEKMPEAALPNPRRICDARAAICGRDAPPSGVGIGLRALAGAREAVNRPEFGSPKSAACGPPRRRAYRPYRRCGRVAEGGGLLNRYRVVKPYRGFESLRLRQCMALTNNRA